MRKLNLLLVGIFFLAVFLRFFQLGINPPSLTWDEVAWGYNAYSLGTDGKDEFGRFLPINYLESFGDFKPPVYAYLDIVPVKIFGLNEFATRFPSAFFGSLTVLLTYFLVKRIFEALKDDKDSKVSVETIALISAFLLAISPWHINLSRAAFEANVSSFFIVFGVFLFLGGISDKKWYLPLSVVSFVLSANTFNTARIVSTLLLLILVLGFRKQLLKEKKIAFLTFILGLILIAPLALFITTPQAKLRFAEVNIFSDAGVIKRINQEISNDNLATWSKIIHNRRITYAVEFLRHYFDNLNPDFLFIKGDGNPKFSTQDVGEMYLWEAPFLVAGVLILFKKRKGSWWIIPLWLILGIVPAATARETPHALRIETTIPTFQILTALGFAYFVYWIKMQSTFIKKILLILVIFFGAFNFFYYLHGYYFHYPKTYSGEWQYGYKDAIAYAQSVENKYNTIYVTQALGRPYIYFLFYTKYDPKKFRKEAQIWREPLGFVHVVSFGKYNFENSLSPTVIPGNNLFIDAPNVVPDHAKIQKTFYLLNGEPSLVAFTI